jgi:hypothetical protein
MLYVLTSSSKPIAEMTWKDLCFRKVSQERAGIFVTTTAEGADVLAQRLFGEKNSVFARGLSREDLQVLQMQCSTQIWSQGETVKFTFLSVDEASGAIYEHKTVHSIAEGPTSR